MAKRLVRMHVLGAMENDIRRRTAPHRIQRLKEKEKDMDHNQHGRKEEKDQGSEERIGQKEGKSKAEEKAKEEAGARAKDCTRLISGGVREDPEDPTGIVGLDTMAR